MNIVLVLRVRVIAHKTREELYEVSNDGVQVTTHNDGETCGTRDRGTIPANG